MHNNTDLNDANRRLPENSVTEITSVGSENKSKIRKHFKT
jgi:hypothetical protein